MIKSEIDKVISLNSSYNIHMPFNTVVGWNNRNAMTGYITVRRIEEMGYDVEVCNHYRKGFTRDNLTYFVGKGTKYGNEEIVISLTEPYHQIFDEYRLKNNLVFCPYGWNNEMTSTLVQLLLALRNKP